MKHFLIRRNLILSGTLLTGFLAIWLCLAACSSDNDDPVDPDNPENPEGPDKPQPGKPLTEEEALVKIDLLDHDFFAYTDRDTDSHACPDCDADSYADTHGADSAGNDQERYHR